MNESADLKYFLSCIHKGRRNAIKTKDLKRLSGMDERTIRRIIELLRRKGHVIVSDTNGYYFPETVGELESYVKKTDKQARSIFFTLQTARNELKRLKDEESA